MPVFLVNSQTYSTLQEVADAYALPLTTVLARMDQGFSLEETVTQPRWSFTRITVNGIEYPSIASASRAFGLDPKLVRSRLSAGWSEEEALGLKLRAKVIKNHNNKGKAVCVQGVKYSSIKEAATAHGFKARFISNRVNKGLTIEQALEIEPFPEWFVPGRGQKRIRLAENKKKEREQFEQETGLKKCSCCSQVKPLDFFHGKTSRSSRCKDCVSASFLRYKYNISLGDFFAMKESQKGLCKICKSILEISDESCLRTKKVAVDHCHATGQVRGLLCSMCNKGLGHFKDDVNVLQAAVEYLDEFRRHTQANK